MSLQQIEPDDFDIFVAGHVGVLKRCPFCGSDPLVHNSVRTEGTFSGKPVYRSTVSCVRTDCMASVGYNADNKEDARKGAIDRWSRRVEAD